MCFRLLFTNWKWLLLILLFICIWIGCNRKTNQTKAPIQEQLTTKVEKKENEFETSRYLRDWRIVENEHPKVSELHIGNSQQKHDKFKVYFDTLRPIPTAKEAIKITKNVLNFKAYNDIQGKETENGFEGNWYHKGIRVSGYYINYKYLYRNKENLNSKYGSYMYVHIDTTVNFDTTNTITKQEAIVIARENSYPKKLDGTTICWDDEDNEDCYPKIGALMSLGSAQNITSVTSYSWAFEILSLEEYREFTFANTVNGFTGKFKQGSAAIHAAAPTCTGCYTCDGNDKTVMTDPTCFNNDNSILSHTNESLTPLPSELDLMVPTRWNDCITIPSIYNYAIAGTPYRYFNFQFDDFSMTANYECNAIMGQCFKNETFMVKKNSNSFSCEEICAYNALNSLADIQNLAGDIFVERGAFTNKANYFNSIGQLNVLHIDFSTSTNQMLTNTFYNLATKYISVGTALNAPNADFSYTDLEILGHEYTHHLTVQFWRISPNTTDQDDTNAILEALADIYSHYFTEKIKGVNNWLFADAVVNDPNSRFPRNLSDPESSAIPQAAFYDPAWMFPNGTVPLNLTTAANAKYYKAGILTYWFYLLTKGKSAESGTTNLDTGIGLDAAEALLFDCLKEQAEGILVPRVLNFEEFRDIMLNCVDAKYNGTDGTGLNLCSAEYSRVYRAFEEVGLLNNAPSSEPNLKVAPPCNVRTFEDVFNIECPTNFNFTPLPFGDAWALQTTLNNSSSSTSGPFYIEVFSDDNNDCIFDDSELHPYLSAEVASLSGLALNIIDIPTRDTKIKIIITDVSNLPAGTLYSSDHSLPTTQLIFTINEGCNISLPGFSNCVLISDTPTANEGVVNLTTSGDVIACIGEEICIDYDAAGPTYLFINANSSGLNFNNNETLPQNCIDGNCLTQGQLCLTPTVEDAGTYTVNITASDNHPTQAISNSSVVTVSIVDPATDVWAGTSPVATTTNASSATANDGSITVNLGSNFGLKYFWYKTPVLSSIATTTTGTLNNLSAGLYKVDVYIDGTNCFYNSYTARVRVNLNTPVCYIDDSIVSTRVAPRIFSDAVTINIALDTEDGFNAQLKVYNMQGIPVANLIEGGDNLLQGGTHTFTFDGSNLPNGLYAINLKLIVPSCPRRVGYDETIRIFKFER